MRVSVPISLALAGLLSATLVTSSFARGSSGGDREPAGGAFMSSYPEQGSTGIQKYGPPRSADIPRGYYGDPTETGSIRRAPRQTYDRMR